MWSARYFNRLDWRMILTILGLMLVSILVISAQSHDAWDARDDRFLTTETRKQLQRFAMGWGVFLLCAGFDYRRLREWTWILYVPMLLTLFGLFFTDPIQRVHRWYRIPLIGVNFQPSEYAKLIVVISLAWFLERRRPQASTWATAFYSGLIVGIPGILILKQPDLGTAAVLFPITLVMFYFGGVNRWVLRAMTWFGAVLLAVVLLIFLGVVSHEEIRPYARTVLRDYQYDRLDPHTHHQNASKMAIALGGVTGTGYKQGNYTANGWLPAPTTDSVFPAFGEEFGLLGLLILMALFYALLYFGFEVTTVAKEHFGRLLSAGITVYVAMHGVVNMGMMTGLLPITGVPLLLVTYGGSSVLSTMAALGVLQSVYIRRFMF